MTSPAYQVLDPSTGEVAETFPHATDAEVEGALAAAQTAYTSWKAVPMAERAVVVKRIAALFEERKDELAAIATQEMGKPLSEGVEEAEFCQAIFDYFATEGPTLAADQPIKTFSGGSAVIQRLPIGVLLGIMPWNFPFYQIARFAAPNLMLGNTIVLKHAESVPRSALAVEQIMKDAGLPEGAYVNVFASYDQVETIIADPRVQGVSLTGSERAGAVVAALAGKNLKKCVLELGGSDPMVVLDADDLDSVVSDAWDFRTYNTGQACNSNKRMIVRSEVYADFVEKIVAKAKAVEEFSPLSSRRAAEALDAQVQDAVAKGATLHAGGVLGEAPAAYYSPAVLTGVTPEMRAFREELFGPVAVVYEVASDEEALALANDTTYGLGGSVISKDEARARALAEQLEVGMANVNSTAGEGAEIPFGGVKRSGFGRELGPLGMDEFVNKRMFYVAD
ncbi:NAD-dependent succinate-semialdehyde dehydrogenase [Nocardioides bruguierae]|uniref:NAD-dependent succinate-semialdehyde dehydrogenase n=1 Tax=Nocardioides bruguierae TaxID=2945102 RepID=A0A9X2DB82_9ACTN|nr:NAD-dependent succinate-semialdehyde dehydrogenase [Nocardioides bruguierae]MCL8026859.1 NAD-dependent succinate-semialdehyde dehydrogenase [Nocardioides bruguierae]MCM0621404.1 NAD-dependent succinate-semialdehyde dehydrogenase [Nocardioides bruguierae]